MGLVTKLISRYLEMGNDNLHQFFPVQLLALLRLLLQSFLSNQKKKKKKSIIKNEVVFSKSKSNCNFHFDES
jgi:hypothetical protein